MQTRLVDLVLNLLRKAQYQGTTPNADELYLVTDDYGVTSADVTNALGYTPYNATNPNGYTSNVGTVTSVNNVQPGANGNVDVKGLYDYNTINANIIGTPTVNDYVVSDFSSSNYAQMGNPITSTFWEFQVKFTTGDTVPTTGGEFQYITERIASGTQYGITLSLDGANPNTINFSIGNITSAIGTTITANTTYIVRVITGFTNEYAYDTNAHVYVYNEAGTLLNSWSGSPSVTPSDLYMKFGTDGSNNFDGSIDFENTYINSIELQTGTLTGIATREWTGIIPIIDAKADYNQLDGQWVTKDQIIASNVSFATGGSETKTYSLTSYLPNDGATYEVLFSLGGQTAATSGSSFAFIIATDIVSNVLMCRSIARTAAYVFSYGNAIVPLTTRQIKVTQANTTSGTPTMSSLRMCGYRRVGTNS